MQQSNSQLADQNTLLKAQLSAGASITSNVEPVTAPLQNYVIEAPPPPVQPDPGLLEKIAKLEAENVEKESELERLRKDQDDLLEVLTDQDVKLKSFKCRLKELGEDIEDSDNNSGDSDND